jgi:hypothetical protein
MDVLRFSAHLFILAVPMVLVGCAKQTAAVSGSVTLDGEPLHVADRQRGTIIFHPSEGGPVGTGVIGSDGTYRVSTGQNMALAPGAYRVTVRVVEVLPATEETLEPTGRPVTPAIYANAATSGLTYEVVPGENQIDLELRSDVGPAIPPDSALRDAQPSIAEPGSATESDSQERSPEEAPSETGGDTDAQEDQVQNAR